MKGIVVLILLAHLFQDLLAQSDSVKTNKPEKEVYIPATMPDFPGGESALAQYLKESERSKLEGTVYVTFEVSETGKVENVMVLKGSVELREEAIRIVKNMPDWKPGMQNGVAVRVRYNLPIKFKLSK